MSEIRQQSVPHVYVYEFQIGRRLPEHPVLDNPEVYKSSWYADLKYSPNHGKFDLYIEPARTIAKCACGRE